MPIYIAPLLPYANSQARGRKGEEHAEEGRVVTLGVIVALVVSFTPGVAGAAPRDKGLDSKKVTVCHVPPGNGADAQEITGNEANAHEITISINALAAHLKHGDFPVPNSPEGATEDPCGSDSVACDEDPVAGDEVIVETEAADGDPDIVESGDVLLIEGDFGLADSGDPSL